MRHRTGKWVLRRAETSKNTCATPCAGCMIGPFKAIKTSFYCARILRKVTHKPEPCNILIFVRTQLLCKEINLFKGVVHPKMVSKPFLLQNTGHFLHFGNQTVLVTTDFHYKGKKTYLKKSFIFHKKEAIQNWNVLFGWTISLRKRICILQ